VSPEADFAETALTVLIDATVVRGILVPAALALLGERAWRGRRG
jgi:putative drug exporter of the RND superfamily